MLQIINALYGKGRTMDEQPKEPANETPATNPEPPVQAPAPEPKAAEAALPRVPDQWNGPFDLYKYSKQAVKINLATIIVLWLLNAVLGGALQMAWKDYGNALSLVLGALFSTAIIFVLLASVRGNKLSIGDSLKQAVPLWLKMIGLELLVLVSLAVSFLLLIVPFFIVLPRITLAEYFLVDKNMGVIEAYKASWAATKGHATKVWGIIGASILMALLMITIIGIPFSIYFLVMYSAAFAVFYEYLNKKNPAAAVQPAATPTV